MSTTKEIQGSDVLSIDEEALAKIFSIREGEEDGGGLALRVAITGQSGVDYTYDLSFVTESETKETKEEVFSYEVEGLNVVIPTESIEKLKGSTLSLPSNPMQGGLVIKNPNRPDMLEGKNLDLSGTTAEKLQQLLDQQINPSLAAHGGFAQLVGVEEATAYLTMGGGCQGCSMSSATLREGIAVMVSQAIPEITEVVDVTDHEAGDNPFYT